MPLYTILANRQTKFEFIIEANNEAEALEEMQRIDSYENSNDYAYEFSKFDVTDIQSEEVVA